MDEKDYNLILQTFGFFEGLKWQKLSYNTLKKDKGYLILNGICNLVLLKRNLLTFSQLFTLGLKVLGQ